MHKLSSFFSEWLCNVIEWEVVNNVADSLFPATAKINSIAMKYKHCEKEQLQQRMQSFNQHKIWYFDMQENRREIEWMCRMGYITRVVEDPCSQWSYIKTNEQAFPPLPPTEYTFASAVVQRWLGVYDFKLEVIPTDKYTKPVPERIVQSALAHRHNFDKIAVMEPMITEIKPSSDFMDDPVLVWQLNWFPNHLFLIDARDDAIYVHSFSEQIVLQTEKESMGLPIFWMPWL